ncbi:hypothetical protein GGTG_02954 [Gaeumannomyces tritici R3-111a-1]|uniref:Uncharacterized protein n=1 Tax=Gaeumannomyces tritici (strain R3-111a-1) TaxID=644352 RepID=J3NNU8_GAET3|nr:hypothetical protein GGTG_02954 [Gaeumannomyces tritici R3-111a-1]EJT77851.1 hypothetical protein GGTG_02954 [Gaeumannomyces tritici R3-111a-1]
MNVPKLRCTPTGLLELGYVRTTAASGVALSGLGRLTCRGVQVFPDWSQLWSPGLMVTRR